MAKQLHYIRDDWHPKSASEAADMTAGGKSTFGGGMTSVFDDNKSVIHTAGFTKVNFDGSGEQWHCTSGLPVYWGENGDNCNELFKDGGMLIKGTVGKKANFLFEVGTGMTSGPTAESIDGEKGTTAIRDVMGFSMRWKQTKSKQGACCIPEKVGLVYASNDRPFKDARVAKWVIPARHKLAGNTIGDKNNTSSGEYWASYSVGEYQSENWQTIKNRKLHWIGVIIQTYNNSPALYADTVQLKIKNFRPLVCSGADWGHSAVLNRSALYNHWRGSGIIDCYGKKIAIANK